MKVHRHTKRNTLLMLGLWLGAVTSVMAVREETFEKKLELRGEHTLLIDHEHGNIIIKSWDKETIRLKGRKIARGSAEKIADRFYVTVEAQGNVIRVKTHRPKRKALGKNGRLTIHYELYAPRRLHLKVKCRHGHVSIEDFGNGFSGEGSHGNWNLASLAGDVEQDLAHGKMTLANISGNVSVGGAHGRVTMNHITGSVKIDRVHSNVKLRDIRGGLSLENTHSNVEVIAVVAIEKPYDLHTTHGNIKLILPAESAIDLNARTLHGRISTNLPVIVDCTGKGAGIRKSLNQGGPRVVLSASHGSIEIGAI